MKKIIATIMIIPLLLPAAPSDDFVITVKTDNTGSSSSTQFTIPIVRTTGNGYNVDCNNDGTDEATGITGNHSYTCSYSTAGTYTIRVKDNNGDRKGFRRIRFYINSSTTTDALKLLKIKQWGTALWSSMTQAFRGAGNLEVDATDEPDLSEVTSLRQMFQDCTLADPDLSNWDVSTITNFSSMFRNAASVDPDISSWNVSNATNFSSMFRDAAAANPDVSSWDVSRGVYFARMFQNADSATPNVRDWNVSKAITFASMFQDAQKADPDVSLWNTSSVTKIQSMFRNAPNADPNVTDWNTSVVTRMDRMFQDATKANPDVSKWNTSQVTTIARMFDQATSFDRSLGNWNIGNLTNASNLFLNTKITVANYDDTLIKWAQQSVQSGVTLSSDAKYCRGEEARDDLISNDSWDISDGGKECPGPCEDVSRELKPYHWTLVSFPCDTGTNNIEDLLGDALGIYNTDWVLYEQTGSDDYIGSPDTAKRKLDSSDTVKPGKGYWIICANDVNMSIDTNLGGLNFTLAQHASNFGISSTLFDDVNQTQLPDTDNSSAKKIMLGNPFSRKMQLSDLYFSHGGGSGNYNPMGDQANDNYLESVVYTFDKNSTSNSNYTAIAPVTPGFTDRIDPMTGFFIKLKSDQNTGSNYMTFPLEK